MYLHNQMNCSLDSETEIKSKLAACRRSNSNTQVQIQTTTERQSKLHQSKGRTIEIQRVCLHCPPSGSLLAQDCGQLEKKSQKVSRQ